MRTKFPVCNILPTLIYIRTPCMKYVQKPALKENLRALQVFLCAHSLEGTLNTIQYNTIQYNIIQYNTIKYNTIQYNTILSFYCFVSPSQWNNLHCAVYMGQCQLIDIDIDMAMFRNNLK